MKTFLNGLSLIIPTALVFYIFLWILEKTEIFFKDFLLYFLPQSYYVPGLGLLAGFTFVYMIGLLLRFWIVQKFRNLIEKLIDEMPIISSIYGGIKDFFTFFSNMKEKGDKITVLVDIPSMEAKVLGLITLEDFSNFDNLNMEDNVLVYIQMSYQIGGYSLFIPKKNLTPVDMNIEDSIRFIMTAGVSSNKKEREDGN
ncbi:MAG: Unknown protein [uncultured Sulfurovum sp.]|uniref:Transporter n=1 Tax=uncultured Sulfurovum sp. TaxID=269237 RepID=A0A6S6SGD2_9BACT|nr:MAG: Unknown protein [uncultured Sulfurovum sp.]